MRPQEFYLLWEAKRPPQPWEYRGTMTERELAELYKAFEKDE